MGKKIISVYERLLEKALEDQKITKDEFAILETIRNNYGIYSKSFADAIANGMIGETEAKHLKEIRMRMYQDALETALEDGVVTEDEQNLLDTLKTSIDLDKRSIALIEAVIMKCESDIFKRKARLENER